MRSLRVSLTVVDPRVGVSHVVPVSDVSFVVLSAGAVLDTTGRFRFIPDFAVMVDGTVYSMTKVLGESVSVQDVAAILFSRPLSDTYSMADAQTVFALKAFADTAPMVDNETIDIEKLLADAPQVLDLAAKVMSKPLADDFGLTDDETVSALKGLPDSVAMQDTIATLLLFIRSFSDSVTVPDLRATLFTPATKIEQITVADTDNIDYQKNIADGFAMNDGSEAVDGSQYSFSKGISNVAFVGDVRSLIFAASRVESVAVADSGVLTIQDYCDLSYFAEDYVGVSQSF